jgi:predicted N-acetyltransferase YhbS
MIRIFSTIEKPLSVSEIKKVHGIMQKGYELTEEEVWGKNYVRLFLEDYSLLIEKGEIYVAYLSGVIVGCMHVYSRNLEAHAFSLLSVDFSYGGKGIGSKLIQRAELEALKCKATRMEIEILRVKDSEVPHKVKLAKYYERLGYQYVESKDCSCIIPDSKYKLLKAPSNFDFYVKELV